MMMIHFELEMYDSSLVWRAGEEEVWAPQI